MAADLITAPTFPLLQQRLLTDLHQSVADAPWLPRWVVVPSATLANDFRYQLARTTTHAIFANVRIVNLPQFADRLSQALLGQPTPAWGPALDLSLVELVAALPPRSPLANLRHLPGGAALLRQTFTDLAEGGFGPADRAKLDDLATLPGLQPREQAVLRLFADWVEQFDQRGLRWSPLVLQALPSAIENAPATRLAAALAAETGQEPRVFVHGFYDWIDVHLEWLTALAQRVPVTFYYPYTKHPAFAFAEPVLASLRLRLGDPPVEQINATNFFLETFPEQPIGEQPEFLTYQYASGPRAEVVSAAVRIRRWLDEDGLRPEDILVIAPRAEDYLDAVRDVFQAFAIPLRVSDVPAGPTPADEPFRILARLWEEQAPAEWVLALLRLTPAIPAARSVNLERFESKVRALGLWGGVAWQLALDCDQFEHTEEDSAVCQHVEFDEAEKSLLRAILTFVPAVSGPLPATLTPADALPVLRQIAENWLTDPALLSPLLATAAALPSNLAVEFRQWTRLLAECGGRQTWREPLTAAVHFLPVMRARGVTARGVVLLGLAAGEFPPRVPPDPLLTETGWSRLAAAADQIGHRLPLPARFPEEMLLLFFLLNTAAERVHWVIPKTDRDGQTVAPTPWVQRYCQRWPLTAGRIGRSAAVQGRYLATLDPQAGRYLPPALAWFVEPTLVGVAPDLPPSIGRIGVQPQVHRNCVGVTRLEALARCPFKFFAETVMRWQPLEPLTLQHALDPRTRGTLLHRLLEAAINPHLGQRSLRDIAAQTTNLTQLAQELLPRQPDAAFALALLPGVFRQAALGDVVRMAAAYFAAVAGETAVPQETEASYQQPWPGLSELTITGTIDRVDHEANQTVLTDYKSGKKTDTFSRAVQLGWMIQAVMYPWLTSLANAQFRYVFLGGTEIEWGEAHMAPTAEELLAELTPLLRQGAFVPTSNQVLEKLTGEDLAACAYCPFASACRRFEPGLADRAAAEFVQIAPARVATLRACAAPMKKKKKNE